MQTASFQKFLQKVPRLKKSYSKLTSIGWLLCSFRTAVGYKRGSLGVPYILRIFYTNIFGYCVWEEKNPRGCQISLELAGQSLTWVWESGRAGRPARETNVKYPDTLRSSQTPEGRWNDNNCYHIKTYQLHRMAQDPAKVSLLTQWASLFLSSRSESTEHVDILTIGVYPTPAMWCGDVIKCTK